MVLCIIFLIFDIPFNTKASFSFQYCENTCLSVIEICVKSITVIETLKIVV